MKLALRRWIYRAAANAAAMGAPAPRRTFGLGILKLDRIGDAVLALGAVRRLLADHPEPDTLIIASPIAAPLFRAEFPQAEVIELPPFAHAFAPDYLRFLLGQAPALRALAVERLVVLRHQPSDYLHTIARLLRPKATFATSVSAPWEHVSLAYPEPKLAVYPAKPEAFPFELEAHRRLVELACGRPVALAEIMPKFRSVTPREGDALLLCPEAGESERAFPAAALGAAVTALLKRHAMPVELCLPPEAEEGPWLAALSSGAVSRIHRPADALALAQTIAGARVVFANESSPAHLATALDKRGAFVLGGGHFGLLAPWCRSMRQRWIYNRLDCYDCRWSCLHPRRLCITDIPPEQVAEAMAAVVAA